MINIERFQCNMLGENCYVANDETNECIIVDCGAWFEEERQAVTDYIKENQFVPRHLLVTHGHADHNLGNDTIKNIRTCTGDMQRRQYSDDRIKRTGRADVQHFH